MPRMGGDGDDFQVGGFSAWTLVLINILVSWTVMDLAGHLECMIHLMKGRR